mmetsp:Transcript_19072/g.43426  ORF Transcript_19072/g.43426 Transcript_19072/m.43426 type:complete len:129 (-) Transcript_19072:1226-1612(-)
MNNVLLTRWPKLFTSIMAIRYVPLVKYNKYQKNKKNYGKQHNLSCEQADKEISPSRGNRAAIRGWTEFLHKYKGLNKNYQNSNKIPRIQPAIKFIREFFFIFASAVARRSKYFTCAIFFKSAQRTNYF